MLIYRTSGSSLALVTASAGKSYKLMEPTTNQSRCELTSRVSELNRITDPTPDQKCRFQKFNMLRVLELPDLRLVVF